MVKWFGGLLLRPCLSDYCYVDLAVADVVDVVVVLVQVVVPPLLVVDLVCFCVAGCSLWEDYTRWEDKVCVAEVDAYSAVAAGQPRAATMQ